MTGGETDTYPPVPFIEVMQRSLPRGAVLHTSFRHLEILLQTLASRAAAVRFSLQSTQQSLCYENIVLCDLLALPIDVSECAMSASRFLHHPRCAEVLYYCVANNVALRRSKLDETKLRSEMQESQEIHLGVDSVTSLLHSVADGQIAEIGLDSDPEGMGDTTTVTQIRLELFRAVCNFLLRHLFWRLKPGEKSKRILRGKERGAIVYLIPTTPRRVDFTVRFVHNDAASTKMNPTKQHTFRTPSDGVMHDVVNGFGYGARSDGLSTAVAVRAADLALLSGMLQDGYLIGKPHETAPSPSAFAPLVTHFLSLPDLLRLRSFFPADGTSLHSGTCGPHTISGSAGRYGDVVGTVVCFLQAHRDALGLRSAKPTTLNVPTKWVRPSAGHSSRQLPPSADPFEAGSLSVTIGVEVTCVERLPSASIFDRLHAVLRHSARQEDAGHATVMEQLAAFGIAQVPPWAPSASSKLPDEADGRSVAAVLARAGASGTSQRSQAELSSGSISEPAHVREAASPAEAKGFILPSPSDVVCLAHNVLFRARSGYVPMDLLEMVLLLDAPDLLVTVSAPSDFISPEDQADVFHALRETVVRLVEYTADGSADDRLRAEEAAKSVGVEGISADPSPLGVAGKRNPSQTTTSTRSTHENPSAASSDALLALPSLAQLPSAVSGWYDDGAGEAAAAGGGSTAEGDTEAADSVFDRCETWFAAARSTFLLRRSARRPEDTVVAVAALQFIVGVAALFVNTATGEYPLRALLESDDELARLCREWSAECLALERGVLARCSKRAGLALHSNSLIRSVLASFISLAPCL